MRLCTGSLIAVICLTPVRANAQGCTPTARPLFEFQVETPATFIPDSTMSPRPHQEPRGVRDPNLMLVSFVVDTLGQPDLNTYKVVRTSDHTLVQETKAVLTKWRYRPALVGHCRVPQLVMTPVVRKQ